VFTMSLRIAAMIEPSAVVQLGHYWRVSGSKNPSGNAVS
jgi:hypothetical protein